MKKQTKQNLFMPFGRMLKQAIWVFSFMLFAQGWVYAVPQNMTNDQCARCHSDQASDFEESIHYINRSGVQAKCVNCHAGKKHKVNIHQKSTRVGLPRIKMAVKEWRRMKKNKSKDCRTCHDPLMMDYAKQEPRSVERHESGLEKGESCIDCHKGISHHLTTGWKDVARKLGLQK